MVEYLESNGKKYPILTNAYVLGKVQYETGLDYNDLLAQIFDSKLYLLEPMIWYSLIVGHAVAKEKFELKKEDMIVFLADNQVYADYIPILIKSLMKPKEGEDEPEESKKN